MADAEAQLFSPRGPLTRDELDLVDLPANTLLLDQLLPQKAVSPGDRWQHSDNLLAMLLGLDAISQSDVYSELKEVDATAARMEFEGHVEGAIGGVSTELKIKGRYKFHLEQGESPGSPCLSKKSARSGMSARAPTWWPNYK